MTVAALDLPILPSGYWLHAHGEGGGEDFDLVMERDEDGLPVLRARHVKGLMRLALERAIAWDWGPPDDAAERLFGGRGGLGGPGCLSTEDARVSDALRAGLRARSDLAPGLFARVASTAVDPESGVAKPKQLRTIEAALPVPLTSRLTFDAAKRLAWARMDAEEVKAVTDAEQHWRTWIDVAWPLVDEIGAKRTRGFGALRPSRVREIGP